MSVSASTSTPAQAAGPSNQELSTPGENNDDKNRFALFFYLCFSRSYLFV
jgi:hypothetical protein